MKELQNKKWLPVALHLLAWLLFFSIPHFMRPDPRPHGEFHMHKMGPIRNEHWGFLSSIMQNLILIPLFYLNTNLLFPRLLRHKRYGTLVTIELLLMAAAYWYNSAIGQLFFPGMRGGGPGRTMYLFVYLVVLSVAYGYYLSIEAARNERQKKEREHEALRTELQFLRWQVSPHFLFNALNNMVALARKKSDRLEPMLINLSGLMRYMLYETDESKVPLQREAQYLQSYIDLQSMRYDNVKIATDIEVPEDEEYMIEPMLLIPFVENAFKHGIDNIEQPEISIVMKIVNGVLLFRVENKMGPTGTRVRDDARGIGLVNTRKRLNLLYGRKYTMNIEINDRHVVVLKIHLI